ncbi:MAG: GH92 family glycosyl hydrolase [Terracidiphilus sp.]
MRVIPALYTLALLQIFLISSAQPQSTTSPYDSVDPLIGTAGGGNTFPGATLPFGMIQWSPDTNTDAWYRYDEKQLYGFSLTHISGAGCPLYGDFAVLPKTDQLTISKGTVTVHVPFDRRDEQAHPGYYAVTLTDGVRVELTVGERAGIARFTFPNGADAGLIVNAGSSANSIANGEDNSRIREAFGDHIEVYADGSFSGWTSAGRFCGSDSHYKLYVAGKFSRSQKSASLWQDDSLESKAASGKHTGAWFDFGKEREILLKVGVSFVSEAGARANMEKEIPGWDFERVHQQAEGKWSTLLNRVAVEGGTDEQRKIFYTGVYHSFLSPNLFSDDDGQYIGFDEKVRSLAGTKQKAQYANFSDWDIYRNTVQWQALFEPESESDMMQSLLNDAEQSGWLPKWEAANDVTYVMGGDSPDTVLSSAYAFGAQNFDTGKALEYMVKGGTQPGVGPHHDSERPFLADYLKLGYSPIDRDIGAASHTLEYASDDFAIAQFAKAIGREDEYHRFLKQSENWKTLLDPETHWIRPRNADGSWLAGFDAERSLPKRPNVPVPSDQMGFEEGNTYQYSFMVPFDYPALFAAMGGEHVVESRLDHFFTALRCWGKPCFNIENEPDFVTPYAYVFFGKPWKTQDVVTRIGKETFKAAPDGIPGNDDLGATSGVYVWNALGFYPAVPGVGGLVIGTPMFDKATLSFAGGRTVVVSREGQGIYVQQVELNGVPYASSWLPISKIRTGTNQLQFKMGTEPNMQRGTASEDRPPSFR